MFRLRLGSVCGLAFLLLLASCSRQEEGGKGDTGAIKKKAEAYVDAYNRQDAKALASLWAEDAEYVDPETGEVTKGRNAIEETFRENFKERGNAKLDVNVDNITFPDSDHAVELGRAAVTLNGQVVDQTAYKAIYKKRNGDWVIEQIREVESSGPPKENEHLKELTWMIGKWADKDSDSEIMTENAWDKYKNFITQHFTVSIEGRLELEGRQVIGWDPISKTIRSWVFDSDGGFGEGTWKKKGNSWIVEASQTLADGRRASSVNIYTPVNANSFMWQSTGREVGGELLPNIEPVTVVKQKG